MQCPNCGFLNQEGMAFCGKCGSSLLEAGIPPYKTFGTPGFVGRQSELSDLVRSLEGVLKGRGYIAMLAGESGIGKTRLAQELASIAESRGVTVLWGRCYEEQSAPPYSPWIQPLREYIRTADAKRLQSEMGNGASDIAEVIADVRQKLTDLPGLPQ